MSWGVRRVICCPWPLNWQRRSPRAGLFQPWTFPDVFYRVHIVGLRIPTWLLVIGSVVSWSLRINLAYKFWIQISFAYDRLDHNDTNTKKHPFCTDACGWQLSSRVWCLKSLEQLVTRRSVIRMCKCFWRQLTRGLTTMATDGRKINVGQYRGLRLSAGTKNSVTEVIEQSGLPRRHSEHRRPKRRAYHFKEPFGWINSTVKLQVDLSYLSEMRYAGRWVFWKGMRLAGPVSCPRRSLGVGKKFLFWN